MSDSAPNSNDSTTNSDAATATREVRRQNPSRSKMLRFSLWLAVTISLFLPFAACASLKKLLPTNKSDSKTERSKTSDDARESRAKNLVSGLCANQFYPVDPGIEREYRVSSAPREKPTTYVLQQSLDGDSSFVEKRSFSSGTDVLNHWQCTREGLRNAEYTNQITTTNAMFKMETLNSSGITLPSGEWKVGQKWTTKYTIDAKMGSGPVANNSRGTVTIDNEIVALGQKISVPAGDFPEAVQVDSLMEINLGLKARSSPAMRTKSSIWFVPEVGMVKQESATPYGKATVEYLGMK